MGCLVATIFSATVAVASLPSPSRRGGRLAAITSPIATHANVVPSFDTVVDEPSAARWVVQPSDSLWRIAETSLGDGARSNEILDLNAEIHSARDVKPGQQLLLPSDAAIPADRQAPPPEAVAPPPTASYRAEATVVIQPGDNLWNLSTDRLASVSTDPPGPGDVAEYLEEVIERNQDVVEDPNLIFPGEVFVMPAVGTPSPPKPPTVDTPPVPSPIESPDVDLSPETSTDASDVQPDDIAVSVPAATAPSSPIMPSPTLPAEPTSASPRATTSLEGPLASAQSDESGAHAHSVSEFPWTFAAGTSTALASGLLLLYRRRRRLAATRGTRNSPQRTPDHESVAVEFVRAADVPLLNWARHEIAAVFSDVECPDIHGVPVAVEISESSGIEMLWTRQNPVAPRPWESSDDGWTWRATYEENIDVPTERGPTPLPGLVTVGRRDGRELLLNLESFGALHIEGDPDASLDLARSMVAELSSDGLLANAYVHAVDGTFDELPPTSRHLRIDADRARDLVEATVSDHESLLADAGEESTFGLRSNIDATGREIVVVVTTDGPDVGPLRELAAADRGVAVLVVGAEVSESTRIVVGADGKAELQPLGIRFEAARLPVESLAPISHLLELEVEELEHSFAIADCDDSQRVLLSIPHDDAVDESDPTDGPPLEPDVMVAVLGKPTVAAFPKLGRMDTSLVVFLAASGGRATDDQLVDAVWNGRLVAEGTVWNRISKVRSVLGALLPARAPGNDWIALSSSVRTDLDYFTDLVEYADDGSCNEAIGLLAEALDLVQGPPFDAPGFDWAHRLQHHQRACELIESTAIRLVDLALDAGAIDTARRGVTNALKALPVNEPLYRARMRIEAAADNPTGVDAAFNELSSLLAEMSDDGFEFEPSARTVRLRSNLLETRSARSA